MGTSTNLQIINIKTQRKVLKAVADFDRDSMLEMFSFEMNNLVDQLEQTIIESETGFTMDVINEIFRIMHTIKGSAAMMLFTTISTATHAAEDLFYFLREENPSNVDYSELTDYVLMCLDFIKVELGKIEDKVPVDGNPEPVVVSITNFLNKIKGNVDGVAPASGAVSVSSAAPVARGTHYQAKIHFAPGAEMENVRAFAAINNIRPLTEYLVHQPEDIVNENSIPYIREHGFTMDFYSECGYNDLMDVLNQTLYISDVILDVVEDEASAPMAVTSDAIQSNAGNLNHFGVSMKFIEGAEMENVRAFSVVFSISPKCESITHTPENLTDENCISYIRQNGFVMNLSTTLSYDEVFDLLNATIYLKELNITDITPKPEPTTPAQTEEAAPEPTSTPEPAIPDNLAGGGDKTGATAVKKAAGQAVISVNVSKLDALLKHMGELVIAEAMVTQNSELEGLQLDSFHKHARQLKKIIKEVQETVMDMRMVSLSTTFFRMNRIVRDMCKQLSKDCSLDIFGETTEVDKTVIEHIGDPLMHIIRNSVDHGIELPSDRIAKGKPEKGTIRLEAKNIGSEVHVIVQDDGAGLNRDKIMAKAKQNGLLRKPEEEYTDKEIFQFIFMPGFSTNEIVTNYSGRGVGMDVVNSNLEMINGAVVVDSEPGVGSTFTLKIPLSLTIIEGMIIRVAGAKYTIPINSIRDSFRPQLDKIFIDPNGNEMITVRDDHYNIVRLHQMFDIPGEVRDTEDGIMMIIENGDDAICLFVDELLGEQQVVSKTIPKYIKKIRGISGCTILGNGDISLIIEVAGFFDK